MLGVQSSGPPEVLCCLLCPNDNTFHLSRIDFWAKILKRKENFFNKGEKVDMVLTTGQEESGFRRLFLG